MKYGFACSTRDKCRCKPVAVNASGKKKTITTGDQRMCRNVGSAFLEDIFYMLDNFRLGLFYLLSFSWINVLDMFHKSYVI